MSPICLEHASYANFDSFGDAYLIAILLTRRS